MSEAPPAQVLPAPGEMPELLPDSQEAGGENASEPSLEEGGGTPVETLPEPQRVVDPTRPMVALTFDDGPHAVYTDQILDILEEHGAVATFFEVAREPTQGAGGRPPGGGHGLRDRQPLLPPRKPGQDGSGRPAGGSGRGGRAVSGGAGHHARAAAAALWLHEQDAEDHLRPEHRHLVHRHGGLALQGRGQGGGRRGERRESGRTGDPAPQHLRAARWRPRRSWCPGCWSRATSW